MTTRWDIGEQCLERNVIQYAKARDENMSQGLSSPAAFANMCLMSGDHEIPEVFGGMYGLLGIAAGPKTVQFIEAEFEVPIFSDSDRKQCYYNQFKPREVNNPTDIYFNDKTKHKMNSFDVSKGYKKWIEDPEFHFKTLHNRRVLIQLGVALCTLGKDVHQDCHYIRWVQHWLFTLQRCYAMDYAIILESLPSQRTLASLYAFFASHLTLRTKLFSFILKYANKPRDHPFTQFCGVIARLLKFSEMEHICLITEHIGPALYNKNIQHLIMNDLVEPFALFLNHFSEMKHCIPNFDKTYMYAMLLYPNEINYLVQDTNLLILTYIAMKLADDPNSANGMRAEGFTFAAHKHNDLNAVEQEKFLTEALLYYCNISKLYESIREGSKRFRRDLMYSENEIGAEDTLILDWLEICGTKKGTKRIM